MGGWIEKAIFYHVYPLGFCGAPLINAGNAAANRIEKVIEWIPHLKSMKINALYLGPVFESMVHGYDTVDYMKIDKRLGTNESFKKVCDMLHANGIRVILDGVFNHVGRDFWAFKDLCENENASRYKDWFCGINFSQTSPYGDPFSYEGWNGHYSLVKLNVKNPEVENYLFSCIKMWIEEFGIDGLRLDAADCIAPEFFKNLRSFSKGLNPDFWLVGEIIHGDYRRWANSDMLDSVTNYECHKGIYSSHNDKNYFEIAYSLNRQFGTEGLYKEITLYNFVDNHDVNRVASMLKNPEHIYNVYTLLYTMPGVPSLYYGSEWGIRGERDKSSDAALRPNLNLGSIENPNEKLLEHIKLLGEIREDSPALQCGKYEQVLVKNEQFVFKRSCAGQIIYCAFNLADNSYTLSFKVNGTSVCDKLGGRVYNSSNGSVEIEMPPYSSMILLDECASQPHPLPEKRGVVIGGKYHHFKGGDYIVIEVGKHTETLEEMVVYKEIAGQGNVWIRPLEMFIGEVDDFGNKKKRFEFIG